MAFVTFGRKRVNHAQKSQEACIPDPEGDMPCQEAHAEATAPPCDPGTFMLPTIDVTSDQAFQHDAQLQSSLSYAIPALLPPVHLSLEDKQQAMVELLEYNGAMCRNFDSLKQLVLQLAEANAQLQEALVKVQDEKTKMEKELTHPTTLSEDKTAMKSTLEDMNAQHVRDLNALKNERDHLLDRNGELQEINKSLQHEVATVKEVNHALSQQLDVVSVETISGKHAAEQKYSEDSTHLKHKPDLLHKCKHLEIDLDKAISAGKVDHHQLVTIIREKDATIAQLEQGLNKLKDESRECEKKKLEDEKNWHIEKFKLQQILDEKEKIRNEMSNKFQEDTNQRQKESLRETVELRTLLSALEKSSKAAHVEHMDALCKSRRECDNLRQELGAAVAAQKEGEKRTVELAELRVQLSQALADTHESIAQVTEFRKMKDEVERKWEMTRLEMSEIIASRERKEAEHLAYVEQLQRKWSEEKAEELRSRDEMMMESKKQYHHRYKVLKKKMKLLRKHLATMTVDHNRVLVRLRECEAELAVTKSTRVRESQSYAKDMKKMELYDHSSFERDMKELADRQNKFLEVKR